MALKTIIRRFPNARFPGSVIVDIAPAINWGEVPPTGHFRFAKSREFALKNQIGGQDAAVSTNNNLTVNANSAVVGAGTAIYVPGALALPASFAVVFRQTGASANQTLAGNPITSGGDGAGLAISNSGAITALSRVGGVNYAATLPKAGGDRWEMIFATLDNTGGAGASKLVLRRPRTGEKQEVATATLPANLAVLRILGSSTGSLSQAVEGALHAYWPTHVLSDDEVAAIYASVKASLAVSEIAI